VTEATPTLCGVAWSISEFLVLEDERSEAARFLLGATDKIESEGVRFMPDGYQPHGGW
jgi:hypothetical protein